MGQREREKEEVETKQGEREWERKQMGVFDVDPPPLPPFSLHAEPRPCLIVLIKFRWPLHTGTCKRTRMCLLFPPLFAFFCHLIKFSCDQM